MESEYHDKKDDTSSGFKDSKTGTIIGRHALSKNICRFELPMDMRLLESKL